MIKIENVVKRYDDVIVEYKKISIQEGGTIISGKNGSGKSTLLKAIAGLIEYEGNIKISGKVSYMPEFPSFPKEVNGKLFLEMFKIDYLDLAKQFHIDKFLDKDLSAMSKGMKGKVNLIQSLATKADWYLLDEPASGLDKEALVVLEKLLVKKKINWVLSTHRRDRFLDIADRVIELD